MKFKSLIAVFALSLLAAFMLFFNIVGKMETSELDLVEINDVVMTASEHWQDNKQSAIDTADKYGLQAAILDTDGTLLAGSGSMQNITIDKALRNRDTICDIELDGQIVGKLVIHNDLEASFASLIDKIEILLIIFIVVVIVTEAAYLVYIHRKVIRPFNRLNSFATSVAEGNLNVPVTMDRENIFGAFSESFDIMREELGKAREGQRKADKSKKELVASLSHDIKSPLASIKAMAELMAVSDNAAVNKDKANNIVSKSDQIEQLVNNLFVSTLEELEQLKVTPECEPSTIVAELLRTADYNHKIGEFTIPECDLYCDRLRLMQVFDNIVSNSYKYANTRISIDTEMISTHMLVTVRDYGSGVDENELPFIKQNFYRASNAAKKTGTGIGLYISDYLMKAMDGEIIADNTEDGFAVTICIKLA